LAFEALITHLVHHLVSNIVPNCPDKKIDVVVGLDSRGFLFGPVIALRLGAAFVPVRKRGKLPGECDRSVFEKEYGTVCNGSKYVTWRCSKLIRLENQDEFEMQTNAISPGQTVVIVDDIIATGAPFYIDIRDGFSEEL
jgi:adenine phosphoribosyltransferase